MTHVSEFETTTDWRRSLLPSKEVEASPGQEESDIQPFFEEEAWASSLNHPGRFRFPVEIIESRQVSREDTSFADIARWGSVFGLVNTSTNQNHSIYVEMPLDNWSWCADPAVTPRICLKKRMSILNVFDG